MSTSWHTPCLRGVLGKWVFYPSLMTAEQIAKHIMPSKAIRESKELDDYLQRDLNPRVRKIIDYLRVRDTRFFNAILLGIFHAVPTWVEFNLKPLAKKLKIGEVPEIQSSMGLMSFDGSEKIFAIDGQHRVEAIRSARHQFPERLKSDQFPVIFLAHLDTPEGKVRTRRLFCDINKNAVPVSEGDKVIIDEDDICAIVTRRLYAEYPPFQKGKDIAVTERKEQLAKGGRECFTSLLGVYTACKRLKKLFRVNPGTLESEPSNVSKFQQIAFSFFDFIIKHESSLNRYFRQKRRNPSSLRKGNRNLLFRPVGLEILARLYAYFSAINRLDIFAWGLQNLKWTSPAGVFDHTIWQNGLVAHKQKAKKAAVDSCLYLLHQLSAEQAANLFSTIKKIAKNPPRHLPSRAKVPKNVLASKSLNSLLQ